MAEHLLIPKRLARRFPWIKTAALKLEVRLVRILIAALRSLSEERALRLAHQVVKTIGPVLPMWNRVLRNQAIAFPELSRAARRQLRRDTFGWLGTAVAELVLADRIWAERQTRCEVDVSPKIHALRERKRPIVFVTAHVGAWQYCNLIGPALDLPISTLYAVESNPYFADLMLSLRNRLGVRWVSNHGGIKTLMGELRSGHSVGLACDTRMDQGEELSFFDVPAMSNTVPARLALKHGCELVPIRVQRLPATRFRIVLEDPVTPDPDVEGPAEQARDMTQRVLQRFEEWIREDPAQWMCLARRWPKSIDKQFKTD